MAIGYQINRHILNFRVVYLTGDTYLLIFIQQSHSIWNHIDHPVSIIIVVLSTRFIKYPSPSTAKNQSHTFHQHKDLVTIREASSSLFSNNFFFHVLLMGNQIRNRKLTVFYKLGALLKFRKEYIEHMLWRYKKH